VVYVMDRRSRLLRLIAEDLDEQFLAGFETIPFGSYARLPLLEDSLCPVVIMDTRRPDRDDFLPDALRGSSRSGAVVPVVAERRVQALVVLSFQTQDAWSWERVCYLMGVGRVLGGVLHCSQALQTYVSCVARVLEVPPSHLVDVVSAAEADAAARPTGGHRDPGVRRAGEPGPGIRSSHDTPMLAGPVPLTSRERQILPLVADGLSNREIGRRLSISEQTVKKDLSRVMDKLDCESRVQVAVYAVRSGMVS